MPEATTLTETEQQKQTDRPEHHQTQAATGSPQAGGSATAGSSTTGSNLGGSTGTSGSSMSGGTTGSQTSQTGRSMTTGGQPASTGTSRRRGMMSPASLLGNPLSMMRSLVDDMDRFFDDFLGFGGSPGRYRQPGMGLTGTGTGSSGLPSTSGTGYGTTSLWYPQIEVSERGGNLVVCADLPGIRKEDVHLEIHDDYLVLEGERRLENEENQGGVYRSERSYGRFYRTIPLPDGTNAEQAKATFKDGVLEVTVPLPTQEQRQGRRIEIQQG
jgi:HSP20 family protein